MHPAELCPIGDIFPAFFPTDHGRNNNHDDVQELMPSITFDSRVVEFQDVNSKVLGILVLDGVEHGTMKAWKKLFVV